jgi:catechol 2,3-dioxygenase-like lactoylglutathione lyase family enzyme
MEARPPVWVGHVHLAVGNLSRSAEFFRVVGMREVGRSEAVVVLELRGGTHLVLLPEGTPTVPSDPWFDLMVDDLEAVHAAWQRDGLDVSPIEAGRIHSSFTVRDPDGHPITVNSSHVVGDV